MRFIDTTQSRLLAVVTAASLCLGIAACGGSSSGGGSDDLAQVSLRLTDAPASLASAAVVTFTEVHFRRTDDTWSRFTLDKPKPIDLLKLQGMATEELLSQKQVLSGDYDEVRLVTSATAMDNYIELLVGGPRFPLFIPSGSSSGIKIKGDFPLTAARASELVADFDLLQSIKINGAGTYMLEPVIRLVKLDEVGHIRGTVALSLLNDPAECSDGDPATDNAVYVFAGHDADVDDIDLDAGGGPDEATPVTTANIALDPATGDYVYEAAYLPAGDYTIALTCNVNEEMLDDDDDEDDLKFFGIQNVTVIVSSTLFL